jgi:hypothetical protein
VVVVAIGAVAYRPARLVNRLPDDYSYIYGPDRPFAPSLARTSTGQAFDARSMGGSKSCGESGCHQQIYREWSVSAHRYSAMDVAFRAVQTSMGNQNGPESTRYCAGCHDPISLFAGTKNLYQEDLTNPIGRQEGVSCIVCHSIKETDIKGNASYVITQPARYLFELSEDGGGRWVRNFLIRAYPGQHVRTLQHRLFKSPEFCAGRPATPSTAAIDSSPPLSTCRWRCSSRAPPSTSPARSGGSRAGSTSRDRRQVAHRPGGADRARGAGARPAGRRPSRWSRLPRQWVVRYLNPALRTRKKGGLFGRPPLP